MRFLLQLGCLFVPGVFSGAQAAIVFMSLEDRGLDFHSGPDFYLKIPLDFVPGDGSLWLAPGSHALSTGHLISQGAVRVLITLSPPPNIGGSVRALEAGSIIGASPDAPAAWDLGEPRFEDGLPVPGDRYHHLYDASLGLPPVSEFFEEKSYIGLEFEIDGQTHYGWLSVEAPPGDYPWYLRAASSRLTGFAYETEPNVQVIAGAIPEPGVPFLLAVGTGALLLSRRKPSEPHGGSPPPHNLS